MIEIIIEQPEIIIEISQAPPMSQFVVNCVRSLGNIPVYEGDNTIEFSSDLPSANYSLSIIDFMGLGVQEVSKNEHGFTVNSLGNGLFNYIAIINI